MGDKVECAINGTVVASYDRSEIVTTGKLKSTDGMYAIRRAQHGGDRFGVDRHEVGVV